MIGLDIDKNYVRVVELKDNTLTKFAVAPVVPTGPEENPYQAISRTIREVFKKEQFDDKEVHTSLSGPRVQVRRISLPFMPEEELREAIRWEAKNFVAFNIETASIDYHLIKEPGSKSAKQELLLVAADGEAIDKHLGVISSGGVKCAGLVPPSFALWELTKLHPEFPAEGLVALVNISSVITTLNIFKKNVLLFTREIDIAGQSITDTLAASLKLSEADAEKIKIKYGLPEEDASGVSEEGVDLTELRRVMFSIFGKLQNEILSSLEYFQDQFFGEKVPQLYLSGGTARLKNLKKYLAANFGLPVESIDPLLNLHLDPKLEKARGDELKQVAPQLATAIGLALGGSRKINLLKVKSKKKEVSAEALEALKYVNIPNVTIIGTLVAIVALIFSLNIYLNISIRQIKNDLDGRTVKLSQMVRFRDRKLAFQDITKNEIDVKLLLARVNALMPKGVSLAYMEFNNAKRDVTIGGESVDPKDASAFVKKVEESPYFSKTLLVEIVKVGATTTFKMGFHVN
ncbi:type IV pilus assembly protein PilM [Candidatus Margulisiibacteriota bacterium]